MLRLVDVLMTVSSLFLIAEKKMFISIQNRIIFLLIAFTLLPFVILKITAFPKVESDVEKMQILHLDSVGSKQAMLVSNWMRERMKDVLVLSDNPYMIKSMQKL